MTTTDCTGSKARVTPLPYNARNRQMHLLACPVCDREWRKQGKATNGYIPVHVSPVADDDDECEGHESLDGAHMGETVYCDGSCR